MERGSIDGSAPYRPSIVDDTRPLGADVKEDHDEMVIPVNLDKEKTMEIHAVHDDDEKKPVPPKDKIDPNKLDFDDHLITLEELAKRYNTSFDKEFPEKSKGLDEDDHKARLLRDGPNKLSEGEKTWLILQYLEQFKNPLTALLLLSGVLSIILYFLDPSTYTNLYLGVILIVVTILNTMIEFVQAQRGQNALEAFKNLIPSFCLTIRNGVSKPGSAVDLVVGDVVQLREGEKVGADVRLFWAHHNMKVDNSSITGEAEPQQRNAEESEPNPLESANMCYSGTLVSSGYGFGVVVRTGDRTILGQIANLASGKHEIKDVAVKNHKKSPLEEEINSFVWIISIFAVAMSLIFFTAGMIINPSFSANFTFLVGILVANVPQGLPSTVTLLLTYAVVKLSKDNVLVKDLQGIDTLGSITLLASDKTGTMTQNRMTVVQLWLKGKIVNVVTPPTTGKDVPEEKIEGEKFNAADSDSLTIIKIACLCTRARFVTTEENLKLPIEKRAITGDATEAGLLRFAALNADIQALQEKYPLAFELPFNTHTKWALTVHALSPEEDPDHSYILFMKGAPERVFGRCSSLKTIDGELPIGPFEQEDFNKNYETLASKGERVLSFAFKKLSRSSFPPGFAFAVEPSENFPLENFTFLSLTGLMDPPKPGVANAIKNCRSAGIKVMMLTGDHPFTAEAIARQVGLILGETREQAAARMGVEPDFVPENEYTSVVVHGDKLGEFTNADWERVLSKPEVVFARMTPLHKLEIVARCQALGHVVAVTGDGVNDAPALKIADLGISMGITGSDVSKEAAKMILLDDNFVTVVHGIQQGRLIFTNLRKSIQYTLTHIWPEIVPFLLFIVAGLPVALSSILILLFDLGTEIAPSISLAWEPAESDLMNRPPRKQVRPKVVEVSAELAPSLSRVPSFVLRKVQLESKKKARWYSKYFKSSHHKDDDRLVDRKLLIWSYIFAGNIEAVGAFVSFFVVMNWGGIPFMDCWGLGRNVFKNFPPTAAVINGKSFTSDELTTLLYQANAAYFMTMVIIQMGTLFSVKTLNDIPTPSQLFKNWRSIPAMIISVLFACLVCYTPGLQDIFGAGNVIGIVYPIAIAFAVALFISEIIRRYFSRCIFHKPKSGHSLRRPSRNLEMT